MSRCRSNIQWLLPVIAVAAAACSHTEEARAPSASRQPEPRIDVGSVPGTYELRVCRLACPPDSASKHVVGATLRRGYLVLSEQSTGFEDRKDSVGILLSGFMRAPINGCYTLDILRADLPSYAYTLGGTHWEVDSSGTTIQFGLYSSPDAGYGVNATLRNGALTGKGESYGAGAAAVDYPPDVIEGHRVGPPNVSLCLAAVGPAWKEIRSGTGRAHHANHEW